MALPPISESSPFIHRHLGPTAEQRDEMLSDIGYASLDELLDAALPPGLPPLTQPTCRQL